MIGTVHENKMNHYYLWFHLPADTCVHRCLDSDTMFAYLCLYVDAVDLESGLSTLI